MDLTLLIQLLVLSPLILVPALVYLLAGRFFKVRDRAIKIIVSLIISLVFASIIPLLLEWVFRGAVYHFSPPLFPWSDCKYNVVSYGMGVSQNVNIGLMICKLSQYYEWALIAAASVFILASFLVNWRAKRKGPAKLVK